MGIKTSFFSTVHFAFQDNNGIRLYSKSYNENARSAPITQQTHESKVFPV